MKFAITAKIQLNMHDLNNERAEEIRRVPIIYKVGNSYKFVEEAVSVSGVMLKHYHFSNMIDLITEEGGKLCVICSRKEAIRVLSSEITTEDVKNWLGNTDEVENYLNVVRKYSSDAEDEIIKMCAGEDVHGFLRPQPMLRRESLVKFSWMLPLYLHDLEEYQTPTPFTILQHSRNIRNIPKEISKSLAQMQMPFPRGYGNGVFAFTSILDLDFIGYSFTTKKNVLEHEEKQKRQRSSVMAYGPILTGLCGASLARALPAVRIEEVVSIISKKNKVSIPNPIHPIYEGYFDDSVKIYDTYAKLFDSEVHIFHYGVSTSKNYGNVKLEEVDKPLDVLDKAITFLGLGEKR
ncbi:MAG: DevR family CRISPR-associated autoregulator [Nitrososphaeria archaeon]|nr:DevR family CRISPR-associated autoregulator [Nitrososphaeria archaeon]